MIEAIFTPLNIVYLSLIGFAIGIGTFALAGSKKR